MADLTDVVAWVGAVSGLGALALEWRTYRDQKDAPVRAEQRALRARVRADAEAVLSRIEASRQAARGSAELHLDASPADLLHEWALGGKSKQFTSAQIPAVLQANLVPLIRWESAAHEYKLAWTSHQSATERLAEFERDKNRDEVVETSRKLGVTTSDLNVAIDPAKQAVAAVLETLNDLDKKP